MTNDQTPRAGDGKTDPSGATYRIETVADMLKVPAERRGVMLRELETTLLTHEFTASLASDTGFEWPALKGMDWTDDGDHATHVSVNGEPLLSLKVTKNSDASDLQSVECPPDPEWVDEQLAAAPAVAPAKPLTDEQAGKLITDATGWQTPLSAHYQIVRATERAHGIAPKE